MKAKTIGLSLSAALLSIGCALVRPAPPPPPVEVVLENEDQKILYALGLAFAANLRQLRIEARELPLVEAGLSDAFLDRALQVDLGKKGPREVGRLGERRAAVAMQPEMEAGAAFLAAAAQEEGAVEHPSGLVMRVLKPGDGPKPTYYDWVRIHYHGTLRDGTVFDSSVERGEPEFLLVRSTLPCLAEAILNLHVGERATVVCPAKLGYGPEGSPPLIHPGATLAFDLELLEIGSGH